MQVILLKDVPKIGRAHEVKNVNDGFATNFLLPKKLAEIATPEKIRKLEEKKKSEKAEKIIRENLLDKNLSDLAEKTVSISAKANEKGHLFSSIHNTEIADSLMTQHNIRIDPQMMNLSKPVKEIGEHEIKVSMGKKTGKFKLIVNAI